MNYRGDTFIRNYSVEADGQDYTFENGDIIRVAFANKDNNLYLEKTISLTQGDKDVDVVWTAEEMATLKIGTYILECEITTNNWTKTIQETIHINLDYIVEG